MSPRNFSKMMQSPYFQTDHYRNETPGGKMEVKIENFLKTIKNKIKKVLTLK
jgi:hypothetical protein